MRIGVASILLVLLSYAFGADLYTELLKERIKSIPLEKAIKVWEGKKRLITFINPDCPHCRKEWSHLKNFTKDITMYVFVLYFNSWGSKNRMKASYILCSEDKVKALEEVLSGKYDRQEVPKMDCPLVEEHVRVAQEFGVEGVPYNIVLSSFKVVEGYSDKLLEYLGLDGSKTGKD
jgi:protein disulfide-isomerase/thiol:disulfide interchange protein DsbC